MGVLRAWAVPAMVNGSPVDHTWVTDFNTKANSYATVHDVVAAGSNFWFCWGDYHAVGRPLGAQSFNPIFVSCLVEPNVSSQRVAAARGTVFVYGVDGVCHQLANQVLYSTNIGGLTPLTVNNARGYFASSFIYRTYGLQNAAWVSKIQGCSGLNLVPIKGQKGSPKGKLTKGFRGPLKTAGVVEMTDFPDDFELHARSVLGDDPVLLGRLLSLRGEVLSFVSHRIPGSTQPTAEMLNSRNQYLLAQAARILGAEKFLAIFGFPAGDPINLVDQDMIPDQ